MSYTNKHGVGGFDSKKSDCYRLLGKTIKFKFKGLKLKGKVSEVDNVHEHIVVQVENGNFYLTYKEIGFKSKET